MAELTVAPTPASFLDVDVASRLGATLARRRRLPASYRPGALAAQLSHLSVVAQERVALEAGLDPPRAPRARVLDRGEWVAANVATVERLLGPAMSKMAEHRRFTPPAAFERISRQSSAAQLGSVLAWLSSRVLGQYDLLVGEEASVDEDVISYVGPNIVALEQRHGFDPDQFRLWLALHETAHRAQFTGVDWLQPYFLSLIDQVVSSIAVDSSAMVSNLLRSVRYVIESKSDVAQLGVAALVASPEQLDALRRLTALMSVLEGHGEVVMDEAATDLVPDHRRFHEVLRDRRASPAPLTKVLNQVLGLDAKLRQYEQGETFVRTLRAAGGRDLVRSLFNGPDRMPDLAELLDPSLWLERAAPRVG